MLDEADNRLLTRVGPGTPMGALFREYWLPFLYSWELTPDGPPLRVRLLGEDLVAFRDSSGSVGLLAAHCPHRGASLFFGRNEECGLRCVYHGWKFAADGRCLDMPNEPPESTFKDKVRAPSYPTLERSGIVWTYMGPRPEPPPFPAWEWTQLPDGQHRHEVKVVRECNWAQGIEGDLDTSHVFLLHSRLRPEDSPALGLHHPVRWAHMEVVDTDYGVMYGAGRAEDGDATYWRTTQFLLPCFSMFPATDQGVVPWQCYTPIDDQHSLFFRVTWHPSREVAGPAFSEHNFGDLLPPTSEPFGAFRAVRNRDNDFLIDRDMQRRQNFSGLPYVPLQDKMVTEGMGPILNRSNEHLGSADAMIIRFRRRVMRAASALADRGEPAPAADRPELYRVRSCSAVLPDGGPWQDALRDWHEARTEALPAIVGPAQPGVRQSPPQP